MQALYKDEDERYISRGTDSMNFVICTERISGYLEGKYFERFGGWSI